MAELTTKQRKKLPKKAFAEPSKRTRNALARVAQKGTPAEKAQVRRAVAKKFPKIGKQGKKGK